ncbi:ATPase, partial [Candidatus Saganbacteria bacterium]|nr:ATPase [Candidatus Saganbacteria bacterium]
METKCDGEIDVLVRARYPLIYVVSWEEVRVLEKLKEMAERRGKNFFLWSIAIMLGALDGKKVKPE